MFNRVLVLAFLLISILQLSAQVKSPEQFLGYKIGSRYTPHWKIVSYFQHVAATVPGMMKLEQYGETNEGRPLLLAYISSVENMQNLDNIRLNNLRLASLSHDKMAPVEQNAPAIVWLSYNVHGDETSSSEAALLTLFALVDPQNAQTKEWLKNTVVIIDPCINPDGRDRYVNWFNTFVGKNYNPDLNAREHHQPWPGGRYNHYNFDLNRDWAWQTQVESQQRIKAYNKWLPQIHVDFHEQEIDAPYYFAPAAQPYHEVITTWQRDFQVTIGRNHAKYFDANGWLYFTKEIFDLVYPAYGDSYPIYNGAIGMTYEQGGGGEGGLGVIKKEGDTLTLYDRAIHHYTTSISTIEVASQNAGKLVKEFRKFFSDAVAGGVGDYKTFVIKSDTSAIERINSLLELLDKNGIEYGTGSGAAKGYNYNTGKEETFNIASNDILLSTMQPHGALVKVLFEPKTRLVDSATYDITAWSLPYVYGLNAYAVKEKIISGNTSLQSARIANISADAYGYVIRWQGIQSAKAVGELLQKKVRLRYAENTFEVNGLNFRSGSIIILKTNNKTFGNALGKVVSEVCNANKIKLYPVTTGFVDKGNDFGSSKVHSLKAPKVVLLTGEGVQPTSAGEVWHFFENELDYPLTLINANDFMTANWNDIDIVIMPNGYNYRFLNNKTSADQFHDWITRGGRVIALQGAVAQLAKTDWSLKLRKSEEDTAKKENYEVLRKFEERDRSGITATTPGSIYKVELDNTHPLAFGYPGYYYTLKQDENMYEFLKEGGWNVGVIKKNNQVAGFVGSKLKEKLKDGLVFGVQNIGQGTVTYFQDDVLFRSFWENGKLMFCNAVFLVGQ